MSREKGSIKRKETYKDDVEAIFQEFLFGELMLNLLKLDESNVWLLGISGSALVGAGVQVLVCWLT